MTDPEAVKAAMTDELRAIVANTADADLRTLARSELTRRHEHQRADVRELGHRGPEPRIPTESQRRQAPAPMTAAEIKTARRYSVVLLDGRRPFDAS